MFMSDALKQLDKLINECRKRLATASDEAVRLEGELYGLVAARRALVQADVQTVTQQVPTSRRRVSPEWSRILIRILDRAPNEVSIDDVMQFASEIDFEVTRGNVRAQLHNYSQRGLLERVTDGQYVATDAIRHICY